ncbi:hypothetical protein AD946_10720 [Gluconobacter thailandicus]|uniref:hypothetical protein n=1 Tax=Gluconobacter thailandicus TaxID=257438 RepID=UPI000777A5E3|nr:hypothetical protein [Gluconobacter thailandicus]KXV52977.1 hypothetical protein AD946_10720 [Gluconobacter thailandicus]
MPHRLLLRHLPRRNRHLLAMSPEPSLFDIPNRESYKQRKRQKKNNIRKEERPEAETQASSHLPFVFLGKNSTDLLLNPDGDMNPALDSKGFGAYALGGSSPGVPVTHQVDITTSRTWSIAATKKTCRLGDIREHHPEQLHRYKPQVASVRERVLMCEELRKAIKDVRSEDCGWLIRAERERRHKEYMGNTAISLIKPVIARVLNTKGAVRVV